MGFGRLSNTTKDLEMTTSDFEQKVDYYKEIIPANYRKEGRGWEELLFGFSNFCPICKRSNLTRKIRSVKTDLCCEYVCQSCSSEYVSYRGLTSLSERDIFLKGKYNTIYSKSYYESLNSKKTFQSEDITVVDISFNSIRPSVVFYCIKPSIADLYYMLPTLYHMRCGYKQAYNIVVFIPKVYRDLIPEEFVDRFILLNKNPREIHHGKEDCAASINQVFEQYQGMISSNLPGVLPYPPDLYKYLGSFLLGEKASKTIDVVFFSRLSSSRKWPNQIVYEKLIKILNSQRFSFRFLAFPENEGVFLPDWFKEVIINPTIREQIDLLKQSLVCVTPHGASEVIPAITSTPILELETIPNWWKQKDPQPIRFGISPNKYKKIEANFLTEIPIEQILLEVKKLSI